jgi:alanine-glyoxylate transaminase / serine-glyoxylate transaminase / serine-pyruvate transaminase
MTPRGRHFFANPGPTNIPDSVMHAVAHGTVDFNGPDFMQVFEACHAGLKRVLDTTQHLFMYTGSGHAAWEATLTNLLSPGDRILVIETGNFSEGWAQMATDLGIEVQTLPADWRRGADYGELAKALEADRERRIKALCVVHNETSTGMTLDLPRIRGVLDTARHPALYLVDTISSLASIPFRMDEWGIDGAVGGSQKGLMLPVGFSFTGVSEKAMAAHAAARLPKHYFSWTAMLKRKHRSFIGTVPIALFYGLQESLRLIEEAGLENLFARHHRLAEAVRVCVRHWAGNNGPELFCLSPERFSDSVTTILMPEGYNADALRNRVATMNVALGAGLARLAGKAFRIGHLGDLNEAMVLGTLGATEVGLKLEGVPHAPGGVSAAIAYLAETAG